jgi:UDP-glucose 4-epimerase
MQAWIYRFGNIIGPNMTHGVIYDFVLRLRDDPSKLVVLGNGTQAKPYVYVDDCLDGMEFGVERAKEHVNVHNLAVDDQTSVREIAGWTIEAMGIDRAKIDVQYGDSPRGWKGDVPQVKMDTRRMARLGWTPKLTSKEATRKTIGVAVEQFRNGPPQ